MQYRSLSSYTITIEIMNKLAFKIRGMDCAEEIAILRKELRPLVTEDRLAFDVLHAKMTVDLDGLAQPPSPEAIQEAVRRTGMEAIPYDHYRENDPERRLGIWGRRRREILCAAAGLFTVLGFVVHVAMQSLLAALEGPEGSYAAPPGLVIVFYVMALIAGGWPVLPKAFFAARRFRADINLLMTLAAIGAIVLGNWLEAASIIFLFSFAQLLESWSVGRARRAIESLMDLTPATARYLCPHDGDVIEKPVAQVPLDAIALVRPGERVPLDGEITKGDTSINQAPITGESNPVSKQPGDMVYAGTINIEGAFEFKVTHTANDTSLSRIVHMVEEAQTRRAPSQQWVDRFAQVYTPAMIVVALLVALLPPLLFGWTWHAAIYQALVMLLIACPCALVISTPVSIVAALASAARAGVLIKGGAFLESPARLRAIALDKTGTLTRGRHVVQQIVPLNRHDETELLSMAAAIEQLSMHPLAQAIVRFADSRGIAPLRADAYEELAGRGAEARLDDHTYWIGNQRLATERGYGDSDAHSRATALEDAGHSVVLMGTEEHVCGLISLADEVRPESAEAVAQLKREGVEHVVMLTGDNIGTATSLAKQAGVDAFEAQLLPHDKLAAVEALVKRYGTVAMVGDGVNDAPAMAAATLGIAMGAAGSDTAIETADIALMADDLGRLPWLMRHSRRTLRIIKQNIAFSLAFKAAVFVLALCGIATLWMAVAADMGASLLVIANGLRLLRAE